MHLVVLAVALSLALTSVWPQHAEGELGPRSSAGTYATGARDGTTARLTANAGPPTTGASANSDGHSHSAIRPPSAGRPVSLSDAPRSKYWNAMPNGGFYNGQVLAMAAAGNSLFVGGYLPHTADGSIGPLGNIARYDLASGTWHALPNAGLNAIVYALAVSGDDLYVGGAFTGTGDGVLTDLHSIVRYDIAANAWHALPNRGLVGDTSQYAVHALAVSGSDLYVGGLFLRSGDGLLTDLGNVARYSTATHTWHPLPGKGLDGQVYALAVSNGAVYVGGWFDRSGDGSTTDLGNIVRYDGAWRRLSNGGLIDDTLRNGNPWGVVRSLAVDGTSLYVGGGFAHTADGVVANLNMIARYDTAGQRWQALASEGLNAQVFALAIDDGELYVGGYLTQTGDNTLTRLGRIARYSPGANSWHAMPNQGVGVGGAGQCRVETIVAVGGDLYVGGGFEAAGDWSVVGMGGIARFGPRSGGSLYLPIAGDA